MDDCRETMAAVAAWLRERHAAVMAAEKAALSLLEQGDIDGHSAKMHEKARLLATMCEDARPVLAPLAGPLRAQVALGLDRFSGSAQMGLDLDSLFYMSALLYRDDHKAGEPDNLQLFIERLEREGATFGGSE